MKIQYISDIHLEFYKKNIKDIIDSIIPIAEILILAGDIGYIFSDKYNIFIKEMSKKFSHLIFILGNHEFYQLKENTGKSMEQIKTKAKEFNINNVHYLDNSSIIINNVKFIGTTLWSLLKDNNYLTNDSIYIKDFNFDLCNILHKECVEFINENVEDNIKNVIISHYLPSYLLVSKKFINNKYNQCYASNQDNLIKPPIVAWIFGHTHEHVKKIINNVKCVCNPIGYPGENLEIDYNKVIDI